MSKLEIEITTLSPLHLGSGHADVMVDAEVVHDEFGMPYFPAKRFKGILFESALEVAEMAELSQSKFLTRREVEKLFQHGMTSDVQLIFSDLFLPEIEKMREDWKYLQKKFAEFIQPVDVLKQYTDLRYQTRLKDGIAADGSLHNMRTVDKGLTFYGTIEIEKGTGKEEQIIALALENLNAVGLKRNRGFGKIQAKLINMDQAQLIEEALKEGLQ